MTAARAERTSSFARGLLWVGGGAAVLRGLYLWQVLRHPILADFLTLDAKAFWQQAERIAQGDWLAGGEVFTLAPLYPYFLAALRLVFADSHRAVYAVQLLVGFASLLLTASLARRCFDTRTALVAAALMALYAPLALLETKVMASTLAVFLGLGAVHLLLEASERGSSGRGVAAGVVLGLTCLARPNTLLFVPLAIAWLAWPTQEPKGSGAGRRRVVAGLALGVAIAIAPATWRNYHVSGDFVPISSQASVTFYQANNERSTGTYSRIPGFTGSAHAQAPEARRIAERELGRSLSRSELDAYWYGRGIDFLASHPIRALTLIGRKALYWSGSQEQSTEYVLATERELTPALWLMPIPFALLLGLAVVGSGAGLRRDRALLLLFVAANLGSALIFYFSSRYRIPAVPFVCVFAGAGLVGLGAGARNSKPRRGLARWWVAGAIALAVGSVPWNPGYAIQAANQYYNLGNAWYAKRAYARAAETYRRALPELDWKWQLHHNLANTYRRLGDHAHAAEHYQRTLEINPRNGTARARLLEEREALASGAPRPDG